MVDHDDVPVGQVGLDVQHLARGAGAVVRAVDVEVVVVHLPDRAVPGGVRHPQQHPVGVIPQPGVPCLEQRPHGLVIDQLGLAGEVAEAVGGSEALVDRILVAVDVLAALGAPVVHEPCAADRPAGGGRGVDAEEVAHAVLDGDGREADLAVEAEAAAGRGAGEVVLRWLPGVAAVGVERSGDGVADIQAVGEVRDARAQRRVDLRRGVALVLRAPQHQARVAAVAQDGVVGLGEVHLVVRRVEEPGRRELVPDHDAVGVFAGDRADPGADHVEAEVFVQRHGGRQPVRQGPAQQFVPAPGAAAAEDRHAVDDDAQRRSAVVDGGRLPEVGAVVGDEHP